MAAPDFGLESLFKLQKIESEKSALILLVHFVLTKNGWLYAGRGTEWPGKDENGSETLPQGWEKDEAQFRYISRVEKVRRYLLSFVKHDVFLLVNLVSIEDQQAMAMNINIKTEVDPSKFATNNPRMVYPKLLDLISRIHEQLVQPCQASRRTVGTSTTSPPAIPADPGRSPPAPRREPDDGNPLLRGEVPLGRRDLDPFIGPGQGGGNILDPLRDLHNPRFPAQPPLGPDGVPLPRGAVPPGARFDPFFPDGAMRPDLGRNPDLDPFGPNLGRPKAPRGNNPFGGNPFGGDPFGGGGFI